VPHKPAYDPTDPRYYDEKDLRSEVSVSSVYVQTAACASSFAVVSPKMFDGVDDYCTEGKYAEVDTNSRCRFATARDHRQSWRNARDTMAPGR
jgi:hypothetical protein